MTLLKISQNALNQLKNIHKTYNKKYIFFGIKSGGCNGFDYILKPTDKEPEKYDEIYKEDTIKIIICNKSLLYLLGTKIDYKSDILGSNFKFTNPNAKSTCGCGTSFNID